MRQLGLLLDWANEHRVRLTLKFIPDQSPSVFVIEAQVPRKGDYPNMYEFVRRRGKTLEEVAERFLEYVK